MKINYDCVPNNSMTTNYGSLNNSKYNFSRNKSLNSLFNKNTCFDSSYNLNTSLKNNIENKVFKQMHHRFKSSNNQELSNLISYSNNQNDSDDDIYNQYKISRNNNLNTNYKFNTQDLNYSKLTYEYYPDYNFNSNDYETNYSRTMENDRTSNISNLNNNNNYYLYNSNNNFQNYNDLNQPLYDPNISSNNPIYNISNENSDKSHINYINQKQNFDNIPQNFYNIYNKNIKDNLNSNENLDLKTELVKANEIINSLKQKNQNIINQRDSTLNQIQSFDNQKYNNENNYKGLEDQIELYKQKLNIANEKLSKIDNENVQLKNIIKDLNDDLNSKNDLIQKLNSDIKVMNSEKNKQNIEINDKLNEHKELMKIKNIEYENNYNLLNEQIKNLNDKIAEEKIKNKKLQQLIDNMNRIDENTKKLLEYLFNFYNNIRELFMPKWKKDILLDVIEFEGPDDFNKNKLLILLNKLKQFFEDLKMKFGKCFACDIACCNSEYERLKFFRKYYPGIPKDLKSKK